MESSDSLGRQQNEYVESWLNNAERNESCPAPKSGSRAPTDRSTALVTSAPSLPTHPPRPGPRRAISGDLGRSRAISGPRRAISGDLGASLARRHTCSKRKEVGGRRSRPIQSAVVAGFFFLFELSLVDVRKFQSARRLTPLHTPLRALC